jgi:hypothetical protein
VIKVKDIDLKKKLVRGFDPRKDTPLHIYLQLFGIYSYTLKSYRFVYNKCTQSKLISEHEQELLV